MNEKPKFNILAKSYNKKIIISRKVIEYWKDKIISKEFLEECESMNKFIKDMTD